MFYEEKFDEALMYSGMMHSAKTSDPMLITFLVKDPSD
jgi:hypothetical protein